MQPFADRAQILLATAYTPLCSMEVFTHTLPTRESPEEIGLSLYGRPPGADHSGVEAPLMRTLVLMCVPTDTLS